MKGILPISKNTLNKMREVFFLDIDDCLIETSRLDKPELTALYKSLTVQKITNAQQITQEFSSSFHRLYNQHQGKKLTKSDSEKLKQYNDKLLKLQVNIVQKYGQIKKWSREALLFIAAEKFGSKLSSAQIQESTDKLWQAITAHNPFYPDALRFLDFLFSHRSHFYLISSSDCRLKLDNSEEQFIYDPRYSRNLKLRRLDKFIKMGVPQGNIFIADPYDKPDPWIFTQALAKAKKDIGAEFISIMAGDSVNNDLLPARLAGMQKLILVNRQKKQMRAVNGLNIEEIKSFDELTS